MIGNKIIELDRVDSTNIYVNTILDLENPEEGTVCLAREQFAGRGQQGNKWESESGKNLTFTVLLKPVFLAASQQFMLNKAIALGALDFVIAYLSNQFTGERDQDSRKYIPPATIKWPNDIYIGNQKIGGILIEHKIMGQTISVSLAGIGLNINQTRFAPDIPNPVSLIHFLRREVELTGALNAVCRSIDRRYASLKERDFVSLNSEFNQQLLGYEQWRYYLRDGAVFEGKIAGVDDPGRLIIESRDGILHHFGHKEVEYLLNY
ncbi:MAG: biotin--[acetyl-CoA-carboxylase] ligase [Bacteroidetes bacterium]|nr:biotin--[acetyl-CoA-carboxylase] ligase [Bacteroidota bacterium]